MVEWAVAVEWVVEVAVVRDANVAAVDSVVVGAVEEVFTRPNASGRMAQ